MIPRLLPVFLIAAIANANEIGDACKSAQDCGGPPFMCADKLCACEAGLIACKTACVDLANDVKNCGWCGHKCGTGKSCKQGVCGGNAEPNNFSMSPVFDTTPYSCRATEAHPTYSLSSGMLFQTAGTNSPQLVSWADPTTPAKWSKPLRPKASQTQPIDPTGIGPFGVGGDSWSTTSGFSGQEYLALKTNDLDDCSREPAAVPCCPSSMDCGGPTPKSHISLKCLQASGYSFSRCTCTTKPRTVAGMIAVAPDVMKSAKSGAALPGAVAVAPFDSMGDGPTFAFDPGGSSLWFNTSGGTFALKRWDPTLMLYPNCKGTVGDATTCPKVKGNGIWSSDGAVDLLAQSAGSKTLKQGFSKIGHTTVIVNPCTHHALVGYIEDQNGSPFAVVKAVNHEGKVVVTWSASAGGKNADTRCGTTASNSTFDCPGGANANNTLCPSQLGKSTSCCDKALPTQWDSLVCPSPQAQPCTSQDMAVRHVQRVMMDVKVVRPKTGPPKCTLLVGWDKVVDPLKTGQYIHRATLGSVDASNETTAGGNDIKIVVQAPDTETSPLGYQIPIESFNAVPVASRFSNAFGFYYVLRDAPGATESFHVLASTDIGFTGSNAVDITLSPPMNNIWEGDNMSQVMGGLPGGGLFAIWPGTVAISPAPTPHPSPCPTSVDGAIITPGVCGAKGQVCCGGGCNAGQLQCVPAAKGPDICDCGHLGEVCCAPNSCANSHLYCSIIKGYKCLSLCGHENQPCCHSQGPPPTSSGAEPGWCYPLQGTCTGESGTKGGTCMGGGNLPVQSSSNCLNFNLASCKQRCATDQNCLCKCNVTAWSCKSQPSGMPPSCDCSSDNNCDYGQACIEGTCQLSQSVPRLPLAPYEISDDE